MAGNMVGAGGGQRQIYSPLYERAEAPTLVEEYLPTDTRTQNKLFRNILAYDAIAGTTTEYWCSMAFGDEIFLSGIEDNAIMHLYEDALSASGVVPLMPLMLSEYLTIGRLFYFMMPNPGTGYWQGTKILDPDYVRLVAPRLPGLDPIMDWQASTDDQAWATMNDPRAALQRSLIEPKIVKAMAGGTTIPLDPINSLFLPRKVHAVDDNGMSYLCRILPFKIYEKAILDASIQGARRRAGPVWWATVPNDYKAEQIEQIIEQLFAAEEDPVGGKVAFREGVNIQLLGTKDDVIKLGDDWDFLFKAKMAALGISSAFLEGDTNYNTLETILSSFLEKLRGVRALFTRKIIQEKIFRTLAQQHGHVRRSKAELSHRIRISRNRIPNDSDLILPKIEWDKSLEPRADKDYWDMLTSLEEKGFPIQMRKWAQAAGYDIKEALQNQSAELQDRAKIYAYKRALIEQAEAAGFDGKGQYLGGEGGGGGETGGFGDLGGGEETGMPELGGEEEAPGLGGGEAGGAEMPALSMEEETSAAPPAPPAGGGEGAAAGPGGEGGGAAAELRKPRFTVKQPATQYRKGSIYSKPVDLEALLAKIPIWESGLTVGLPRRRVAQLLDEMTRRDPRDRRGPEFYRWARREQLSTLQADIVEYCAARVGIVEFPEMASDSVAVLAKMLVKQADITGLTPALDEELDVVGRMTETDPLSTAIGSSKLTSHSLPDSKLLTGLTE
ncbi:MAG: hypothetical protein WC505_06685 [Patescibacteria group bacterium]